MTTSGPALPQSSVEREVGDLATGGRTLWLAAVLPPGPTVLWAADRQLAVTLAQDPGREVVLLEPREAEAAVGIRHGSSGLLVRHVAVRDGEPDLEELRMAGFAGAVIDRTAVGTGAGDLRLILRSMAPIVAADAIVVVLTDADGVAAALQALDEVGRTGTVVAEGVSPCAHIGPEEGEPLLRVLGGGPHPPERCLVVAGVPVDRLPRLLVLGLEDGVAARQRHVEEMAATIAALDAVVDRHRAQRIEQLEATVARCQADLAQASRTASELEAVLAALHASTSWRVTRPLRALRDRAARR